MLISSAGALGTSMEYTLDGIRHVDPYDGYPLTLPFPDALAEFKTEIGGLSASQARGSQVSIVTKSGTNTVHGTLHEYQKWTGLTSRLSDGTRLSASASILPSRRRAAAT
jgi:hypothetical protein